MPKEFSAGAIIFTQHHFSEKSGVGFRKDNNEIYYLLLYYPSVSHRAEKNYWDFTKGHINKGESGLETAIRESREETGLNDIKLVEGFKEEIKYFFRWGEKNIFKSVIFYLFETKTKEIKISSEHLDYKWLPYEEALERLTFKSAKEILKKANGFLISKKSI